VQVGRSSLGHSELVSWVTPLSAVKLQRHEAMGALRTVENRGYQLQVKLNSRRDLRVVGPDYQV
jgi:hypothetical protein